MPTLPQLIDTTIIDISQRKLVSSDEMVDVLLDIRQLWEENGCEALREEQHLLR